MILQVETDKWNHLNVYEEEIWKVSCSTSMNIKTQSSPLTQGSETIEKDGMESIWKELMSKGEYDQNELYICMKFSKICINFFKK